VRGRIFAFVLLVGGLAGINIAASGATRNASSLPGPTAAVTARPEPIATPAPSDPSWIVRAARPVVPTGPRRVAIQAGHWKNDEVPEELARLRPLGGALWGDLYEWALDLDIAQRVAKQLRAKGFVVDILPTTVPPNYVADVFVALHADGDETGTARGFKIAHGERRSPFEDGLVKILYEEYQKTTGLPTSANITPEMSEYYAFRWERFLYTVNPHTPAAIIEMGFISNAADRAVLVQQKDRVALAITNGVVRFLNEVPRDAEFSADLVLPKATPEP
jgi:N-acetylmuramoyl-L-alanine amidase